MTPEPPRLSEVRLTGKPTYVYRPGLLALPESVPEVVTHSPVVLGVAQGEAQKDPMRNGRGSVLGSGLLTGSAQVGNTGWSGGYEVALHDYIRPVSAADVDASDLRVARAKAHVREQLNRLTASKALFR